MIFFLTNFISNPVVKNKIKSFSRQLEILLFSNIYSIDNLYFYFNPKSIRSKSWPLSRNKKLINWLNTWNWKEKSFIFKL